MLTKEQVDNIKALNSAIVDRAIEHQYSFNRLEDARSKLYGYLCHLQEKDAKTS